MCYYGEDCELWHGCALKNRSGCALVHREVIDDDTTEEMPDLLR